jgi:bacteriocin biosynthesis cyclodehydratase domain-containing protein
MRPGKISPGNPVVSLTVGTCCQSVSVRPALKPGLLPVWRDRDTLQIGIDPRRAVALTGMAGIAWFIGLLDGSRDREQVIRAGTEGGIPQQTAERLLALLAAAGAIDDFPAGTLRVLPQPLRSQLAAELATVSLARRDGDGGARTLARRTAAQVSIHGGGRAGTVIASLLTTSGIGQVTLADQASPSPPSRDAAPPDTAPHHTAPPAGPSAPLADLAILTDRPSPDLHDWLMREHIPHLAVSASEAIGVVGPLVIPGTTACLRCLDLARADRDPAWPLILAQLSGRQPDPASCDAPLAAAVAAQAALQALTLIDRAGSADAVTNGTLELVLPGWQWRRRTWPPHPRCSCRAAAPVAAAP